MVSVDPSPAAQSVLVAAWSLMFSMASLRVQSLSTADAVSLVDTLMVAAEAELVFSIVKTATIATENVAIAKSLGSLLVMLFVKSCSHGYYLASLA